MRAGTSIGMADPPNQIATGLKAPSPSTLEYLQVLPCQTSGNPATQQARKKRSVAAKHRHGLCSSHEGARRWVPPCPHRTGQWARPCAWWAFLQHSHSRKYVDTRGKVLAQQSI